MFSYISILHCNTNDVDMKIFPFEFLVKFSPSVVLRLFMTDEMLPKLANKKIFCIVKNRYKLVLAQSRTVVVISYCFFKYS